MRTSLSGRQELASRVQQTLALPTKREAETILDTVVMALEATLLNNLGTDGFTLKLNGFGKFYVRHKPGIWRKIGFSGDTIQTKALRKIKFVSLGQLRESERVSSWKSAFVDDFENPCFLPSLHSNDHLTDVCHVARDCEFCNGSRASPLLTPSLERIIRKR